MKKMTLVLIMAVAMLTGCGTVQNTQAVDAEVYEETSNNIVYKETTTTTSVTFTDWSELIDSGLVTEEEVIDIISRR